MTELRRPGSLLSRLISNQRDGDATQFIQDTRGQRPRAIDSHAEARAGQVAIIAGQNPTRQASCFSIPRFPECWSQQAWCMCQAATESEQHLYRPLLVIIIRLAQLLPPHTGLQYSTDKRPPVIGSPLSTTTTAHCQARRRSERNAVLTGSARLRLAIGITALELRSGHRVCVAREALESVGAQCWTEPTTRLVLAIGSVHTTCRLKPRTARATA